MPLSNSRKEEMRLHELNGLLLRSSAVGVALVALLAGFAPAFAANECGAAVGGTVACTAGGNPYAAGITYTAASDISVTTSADTAATNTVKVTGTGITTITDAGTVTTTLANQPGIVASGTSAVVNSTGNVSTAGTAGGTGVDGITVTGTTGSATAAVRNVSVTGAIFGVSRPRALVVTAAAGASTVVNGTVSSTSGDGVVMTGVTTTATIASGASVSGGVNGVVLTGTSAVSGTRSISLANAGTIAGGTTGAAVTVTAGSSAIPGSGLSVITNSGTIGNGANLAILVNRGIANITNSGTINGRIRTAFENDVVTNSGVFNAFSNSDFGDGNDTFNNSGTLNVLPAGAVPSAVVFTELETFNNSGTINLANGSAFNTLTLPGTFTGSGASSLFLDVAVSGTPASDRLIVSGAANGSTAIVLNGVNVSNAGVTPGLILATGGAGSSATAFTVAAPYQNVGFINYIISPTTTAAGTTTYALVGTPGDSVVRALKINEGAQNLWHSSADAWAAHTADVRTAAWGHDDAEERAAAIWMIAQGGIETRDDSKTTTAFGFSRNVDTSYQQDSFGVQFGADIGGFSGIVFGITAGYATSHLKLLGASDRSQFQDVNAGIYGGFVSGPVFANVLLKYDHLSIDSQSPVASFNASYHGKSLGVQGEIGARLGSDTFFAEPSISAALVRTDLNSPIVTNATLNFDQLDGIRGKAGLRIGTTISLGRSNRGVLYASGSAVHEFEGRDGLSFTSNGTIFRYTNNRLGTYAEGKIGLNMASAGALSGFIEGFGNFGDDYHAGGARAGLRLKL